MESEKVDLYLYVAKTQPLYTWSVRPDAFDPTDDFTKVAAFRGMSDFKSIEVPDPLVSKEQYEEAFNLLSRDYFYKDDIFLLEFSFEEEEFYISDPFEYALSRESLSDEIKQKRSHDVRFLGAFQIKAECLEFFLYKSYDLSGLPNTALMRQEPSIYGITFDLGTHIP